MFKKLLLILFFLPIISSCSIKSMEDEKQTQKETHAKPTNISKKSIIESVQNDDLKKLKYNYKKYKFNIDTKNDDGDTLLLISIKNDNLAISKFLVKKGANINYQNNIKDSPYLYAGAEGKSDILTYMIKHSSPNEKVLNRYEGNALIPAAEKGHLKNVRILLNQKNVDINHQNEFGYTALIEAVALSDGSTKQQKIVECLLQHNADSNIKDNYGKTAEDYAEENNFEEIQILFSKYK